MSQDDTTTVRYVGPHDHASTPWGDVENGKTIDVPANEADGLVASKNFEKADAPAPAAKPPVIKPGKPTTNPAADGQEA